jgi:predicted lipoprotein with Yx(FWY)xxD motif
MRRSHLVRLGIFAAVGFGTLTACSNGEAVSAARVSVAANPSASTESTTTSSTPPPVPAAAPKLAAPVSSSNKGTPPPPATSSAAPANPAAAAEPERLTVTTNPKLGKIVTDNRGHTIYRLDADPVKPPKSTCVDDCAKRFPPVLLPAGGVLRVDGIDSTLIGSLTRADNTIQVTLAGHPLYRYAGDGAPGDTLGQGITGGAAITPTGGKAVGTGR